MSRIGALRDWLDTHPRSIAIPLKLRGWLFTDPQTDPEGLTPTIQLAMIVLANILIAAGVWYSMHRGFHPDRDVPHRFKVLEIILISVGLGLLACPWVVLLVWSALTGKRQTADLPFVRTWLRWQDDGFKPVVLLLTGLMIASLYALIRHTGGGIASPFGALLPAPAIFGPFLTRNRVTVLALTIAVGWVIWIVHGSSGGRIPDEHARMVGAGIHRVEKTITVDPHVYSGVAIGLIVISGTINFFRIGRQTSSLPQ